MVIAIIIPQRKTEIKGFIMFKHQTIRPRRTNNLMIISTTFFNVVFLFSPVDMTSGIKDSIARSQN